jgi:hypothetical protein
MGAPALEAAVNAVKRRLAEVGPRARARGRLRAPGAWGRQRARGSNASAVARALPPSSEPAFPGCQPARAAPRRVWVCRPTRRRRAAQQSGTACARRRCWCSATCWPRRTGCAGGAFGRPTGLRSSQLFPPTALAARSPLSFHSPRPAPPSPHPAGRPYPRRPRSATHARAPRRAPCWTPCSSGSCAPTPSPPSPARTKVRARPLSALFFACLACANPFLPWPPVAG